MKQATRKGAGRAWVAIVLIILAMLVSACGGTNSADRGATSASQAPASSSGANSDQSAANNQSATNDQSTSSNQAAGGSQAVSGASAPLGAPTAAPQQASGGANASAGPAGGDFSVAVRNVTQKVRPAVVQITNEQVQASQFGQATIPAGVGSGVIYDNQGHILTNNHVVADAQGLLVSLPDGRTFKAKVVGTDPGTDLAVIQISGNNLPVAQLGDSHQLQVGDWVVAIGNALGLAGGPTVTAGVVSALGRTVQEPGDQNGPGPFLFDVVQTSAPINPGNSGGALVDLNGRVIGINTLVAGQAEPGVQAQGIGFAISISTAKPFADQLVASGRVVHPSIGIQYVPLNPAIAAQVGVDQPYGALVMDVVAGSGAAKAGLQQGDVIVQIDGTDLKEDSALAQAIQSHKPGDKVTLTILRNNIRQNVTVTLGQAAE